MIKFIIPAIAIFLLVLFWDKINDTIYKKFNINRFSDDYMKEFWNLVQGEENTLHRQGKNTL